LPLLDADTPTAQPAVQQFSAGSYYSGTRPAYTYDGRIWDSGLFINSASTNFVIDDIVSALEQPRVRRKGEMKDKINGGVYAITRTNGNFAKADLALVQNPLSVNYSFNQSANQSLWAMQMGNYSQTFTPQHTSQTWVAINNLHPSCMLNCKFEANLEIVPGDNSPFLPWAHPTPLVSGMMDLYKAASFDHSLVNPASANDTGTLWQSAKDFFFKAQPFLAGAANFIPEIGPAISAGISAMPRPKPNASRKTNAKTTNQGTANPMMDQRLAALENSLRGMGLTVKKAKSKPQVSVKTKTKVRPPRGVSKTK